jgi:hypothetical protein
MIIVSLLIGKDYLPIKYSIFMPASDAPLTIAAPKKRIELTRRQLPIFSLLSQKKKSA